MPFKKERLKSGTGLKNMANIYTHYFSKILDLRLLIPQLLEEERSVNFQIHLSEKKIKQGWKEELIMNLM